MFDLPVANEFIQRLEGLVVFRAAMRPVNEIQVEIIHLQAAQGVFAGFQHVIVLQVVRRNFGSDKHILAFCAKLADRPPDQFLAAAVGVHLRRVEVSVTDLQRAP